MKNTVYRTRTGYELLIPFYLILSFPIYQSIKDEELLQFLLLIGLLAFFNIAMLRIFYRIEGKELIITYFQFFKKRIPIDSIIKIEHTNNLMSSPAGSIFGRIEIFDNKGNSIIISPKKINVFLEELKEINRNITIKI